MNEHDPPMPRDLITVQTNIPLSHETPFWRKLNDACYRMLYFKPRTCYPVVSKWLAEDGQRVQKGQLIAEIETNLMTSEIMAIASGVIRQRIIRGQHVGPHDTLAVIEPETIPSVETGP